jgi:hypothetical protein
MRSLLTRVRKETRGLVLSIGKILKKGCTKKDCDLCKKHRDVHTTHNTKDCRRYKKDGIEKSDFCAAKKGRKKSNPTKHSIVQLSKKMDRLKKVIKKQDVKRKKHCHSDSDSNSE